MEKAFQSGAVQPGDWPSDKWWESFGDPQLNRLVERALAGAPDINMARARASMAEHIARAAGAVVSPNVSAGAGAGLQRMSENSLIPAQFLKNPYSNADVSLSLGYNLDLWGAASLAVEGKIDQLKAAQTEGHAVRLALAASVARGYINLRNIRFLAQVAGETLAVRRESMEMIRKKLEKGLETELNLERARLAVMGDEDAIAVLEEAEALERSQLAALIGAGPDDGAEAANSFSIKELLPAPLPNGLPLDLVHRRPDVCAARWRVEAAAKGEGSARAAFYPNINLRALAGLQTVDMGKLFTGGSFVYNASGAVHLPLFDGGALRANLGLAEAEYSMAAEKYNQAVINAARETAAALSQMESAARRIEIAKLALASAQKARQLTMARFDRGVDDYLTVLKAQDDVFALERKLALLNTAALQARVALIAALGGGFSDNTTGQEEARQK